MEKKTNTVETFIAFDGKTFTSQKSCEEHEAELLEVKIIEDKRLSILEKLNAISVKDNYTLYEKFCDGYDYFFKAYKFVYHSDCSLMDILFAAECGFTYRKEPIYTIKDGNEVKFSTFDFPQLEIGETYLIVNYLDLSGDYNHDPTYFLAKLSDYKEYLINEINDI